MGIVAVAAAGGLGVNSADALAAQKDKPRAYLVADAHLDTQWNWDIQTTIREYVWNTINQNLMLLEQYPDYVFNFEGGVKYKWMKEYYPREYELIKPYINNGRWHIAGASWDATDAIVPSVESAIRNIMHGQNFYRQEFGVESTDIFLPDCFGFGHTLPTIASHCGLIGFSSQKLGWRHVKMHGDKKYPFTLGLWQGVDGSRIFHAHGYGYGHRWKREDLTESKLLNDHIDESGLNMVYNYYGTGDIGGSPTLTSVDAVQRGVNKKDGRIEVISATSDQLYKDHMPYEAHPELPVYDGELLMDVHGTGCYTSQAAMKRYNRQNEQLGDAAERISVAAELLGAAPYPSERIAEAWKRFIFHQFHDDLTGTSIPRAYEFSWNDELLSLKDFSDVIRHGVDAISARLDTRSKGVPVVMFNPLWFPVSDVIEIEIPAVRMPKSVVAVSEKGKNVAAQVVGYANGKAKVLVATDNVPANGMAVYDIRLSGTGSAAAPSASNTLENSRYKITFDGNGDISSLYDKANSKELVKDGKKIRLAMFTENESFAWPAWEIIKGTIDKEPVSITEDVKISLVEDTPLRKTLRVSKRYGDSQFNQYVSLYEGELAHRVDFYNEVDWRSTNALLKAEFPLAIANGKASYDLGLGVAERGNNTEGAYEVYAQQWADLTDRSGDYGVTVMNDCKYGWDKPDDNTLRLTLLHTPKTKGGYAYQDHQDFGHHTFTYSLVGHKDALDRPLASRDAERLNQRLKAFVVSPHKGDLGKSYSVASADNTNVAIKALKKAELSDEYVVRVYDISGQPQKTVITFNAPIISAALADGTEKSIGSAAFDGNNLSVDLSPNSMRTYKVKLKGEPIAENTSKIIPLDYNKNCISWNQFRRDGDFSEGNSFAAELLPSGLSVGNVNFKLENRDLLNGLQCKGDTITLPSGCNRVYLLAAAAKEEGSVKTDINIGGKKTSLTVPSYTGFIGQWGHDDHTQGYMYDQEVAYVGTHRHSPSGDMAYEFTYLFSIPVDIPKGATQMVLPDEPGLVIFAATAVNEADIKAKPARRLFVTNNIDDTPQESGNVELGQSLLDSSKIIAWSGFVNDDEHPRFLVDGKEDTKWCDVTGAPSYVDFDLGATMPVSSWRVVNAGNEDNSYITSTCMLQGRDNPGEDWKTIDTFSGNHRNVVVRKLSNPASARYLRLMVVQPTQEANSSASRIYELGVY